MGGPYQNADFLSARVCRATLAVKNDAILKGAISVSVSCSNCVHSWFVNLKRLRRLEV